MSMEGWDTEALQKLRDDYADSTAYAKERVAEGASNWHQDEVDTLQSVVTEADAELKNRPSK